MKKFLVSLVYLISQFSFAEVTQTRIGLFYNKGEKNDKYLFRQETKVKVIDDLNRSTDSTISDPNGKVLMKEVATIKDGVVVSQVMEQLQISEKYVLDVKGGKAHFQTFDTKNPDAPKLKEENTVKVNDNFFTGPSLEVYLKKNLEKIKNKKSLEVDFGIFELQKPFTFDVDFSKIKFNDASPLVPVKMEIGSTFLSFFADPLYLAIDPETAMLVRFRGRTPVRISKNGKLVPFDGDIYYELQK